MTGSAMQAMLAANYARILTAIDSLKGGPRSLLGTAFHCATWVVDANEWHPEVFKKCRTCHQVGDTAKNSVGPVLNGIIGQKAGSIEGFSYSPANKDAGSNGLVWTEENLFKYLENSMALMPKTKMIFPGIKDEQDRKDVIAYLKKFAK